MVFTSIKANSVLMREFYLPVLKITNEDRFCKIKESVHSFLINQTTVTKPS